MKHRITLTQALVVTLFTATAFQAAAHRMERSRAVSEIVTLDDDLERIGAELRAALVTEAEAETAYVGATVDARTAAQVAANAQRLADDAAGDARLASAELAAATAARQALEVEYQEELENDHGPPVDPDPPEPDDDPWTWALIDGSMEDAKAFAREQVESVLPGPETRTDAGFDVVFKSLGEIGGLIQHEERYNRWGRTYGLNTVRMAEDPWTPAQRGVGLRVDNVSSGAPQGGAFKWWLNMKNLPSAEITRCAIYGVTRNGIQLPKEHAFYLGNNGDVTFRDLLGIDLGGHVAYMSHRPYPSGGSGPYNGFQYAPNDRFYEAVTTKLLENVVAIDCEQDASRGAFSITGNDIGSYQYPGICIMRGCLVFAAFDYQRPQGNNNRSPITPYRQGEVRACGAVVVTNFIYTQSTVALSCAVATAVDVLFGLDTCTALDVYTNLDSGWPTESFLAEDCAFWTVQAKHPLLLLRNAKSYTFKDCAFRTDDHPNPVIEVGAKKGTTDFRGPASVVVENCHAVGVTLRIWLDSATSEDYTLETPGVRWTWTPEGVTVEDL